MRSLLSQVIIALQERSMGIKRGHVPYRNSTLTTVLRDRRGRRSSAIVPLSACGQLTPRAPARSLGGNCRTAMVATVQPVATQARGWVPRACKHALSQATDSAVCI